VTREVPAARRAGPEVAGRGDRRGRHTESLPKREVARLLLQALRVDDVDEILNEFTDPETGEYRTPERTAGEAAVDKRFRRGGDPADGLS
jgi:hypothetical protein